MVDDDESEEITPHSVINGSMRQISAFLAKNSFPSDVSKNVLRRQLLKMNVDIATISLQSYANQSIDTLEGQIDIGFTMREIDELFLEIEGLTDSQFDAFWSIHNPDTSTDLDGNIESARLLET
jgi:hypothetical protein